MEVEETRHTITHRKVRTYGSDITIVREGRSQDVRPNNNDIKNEGTKKMITV